MCIVWSTYLRWRNKHKMQVTDGWESCMAISCCQILPISMLETLHSVSPPCCSNSIIFFETNLGTSVFPLIFLSLFPAQSLHPSPSLLCMCAFEPITEMEKPQIVHSESSRDLMNLCVVLWLEGNFMELWLSYGT